MNMNSRIRIWIRTKSFGIHNTGSLFYSQVTGWAAEMALNHIPSANPRRQPLAAGDTDPRNLPFRPQPTTRAATTPSTASATCTPTTRRTRSWRRRSVGAMPPTARRQGQIATHPLRRLIIPRRWRGTGSFSQIWWVSGRRCIRPTRGRRRGVAGVCPPRSQGMFPLPPFNREFYRISLI